MGKEGSLLNDTTRMTHFYTTRGDGYCILDMSIMHEWKTNRKPLQPQIVGLPIIGLMIPSTRQDRTGILGEGGRSGQGRRTINSCNSGWMVAVYPAIAHRAHPFQCHP